MCKSFILVHALWGALAGGLMVITPVMFPPPATLWLVVLIKLVSAQPAGQRWRNGLAMLSIEGVAVAVVIMAAALAPVKTENPMAGAPGRTPKNGNDVARAQRVDGDPSVAGAGFALCQLPGT